MSAHRIVFVEASIGGVVGGSLTGILHLLERIDRTRFAPSLVLYEEKPVADELRASGIPVHVLPPLPGPTADASRDRSRLTRAVRRLGDLLQVVRPRARALMDVFERERPALVYLCNGLTANLDGVLAAARCGLPVICHEKGFRRVGPAERLLSRWIDTSVGMTDEITEYYRSRHVRARRFLTILDGIDCTQFGPGGGAAIRREFCIPPAAPLVGIVGHIQEWKGQMVVAEAVAQARVRFPELRCLMVGGVHRQGEAYGEALRARIAAPDLAGHVILTGARRDVSACLDAMDVAIHSSTSPEPFGRVMIEAMALGRPVIAPREGGPIVIVVDGETGLLVPPRDPGGLAAAIAQLVGDPQRRLAMGRAARARVDAVFDIRHHVAAVEALFDDVLGLQQRPTAVAGKAVA
ncbi:MAG TPA: glycosyltransferase family 4 protein [Candidatus Binatia bacterium]|jgi:glycosyltransferase involved in cell wall biosynthesis|nr:glycosyltransferase family 4 protein [Candidatus Binatia bacterium]